MTTGLVVSVTDELVAELERECREAADIHGGAGSDYDSRLFDRLGDALKALLAERAELLRVIADVKWRVADTTDQLQATGFDGDRRYGLDEWSGPIKNLNMAIGILEKSLEPNK